MDAYVVDWVRSARGAVREGGGFASVKPIQLLKQLYEAMGKRLGDAAASIEDVVLGCVTAIGEQGANIAKISSLYAGFPESISGLTLNRFCASGLDAVSLASAKTHSQMEGLVLAGGVECLSRVPMFRDGGAWFRDPEVMKETRFLHMGLAADLLASLRGLEREDCDAFALSSHQKAAVAIDQGHFSRSLIPIRTATALIDRDEWVRPTANLEKFARMPLAFETLIDENTDAIIKIAYPALKTLRHVHTAASSPGIVDGAALMSIANEETLKRQNLKARGRILAFANSSVDPVIMLTGGLAAARKVLQKVGLKASDIDLWEVNESFAATVLDFIRSLEIDPALVNVNGGSIALGHPLGATGTILLGTALDELERRQGRYACIAICAGAGIGQALVLEKIQSADPGSRP